MDLMDLFIKVSLEDEASDKVSEITDKVGEGLKAAAEVGAAAVTAAGAAIVSVTTEAVEAFSEYEQLVGGVETLFGDSADTVVEYAKNAYETAGLSANEYMETVTSFSASLLQGLGGDTEEAANIANLAITDMSDNANKMGTDMTAIQNAYQGFAKQNYTMLDNLKLGYGGTQEEMIRLINDANQLDSTILGTNETITSLDGITFDQIIMAIHTVQENMGITGTTALEASTTIQGSASSVKAAWENVLVALAGGTEEFSMDVETAISNLITTICGEGGEGGLLNNIEPVVLQILNNIPVLLEQLAPTLTTTLSDIINNMLPSLIEAVTNIISSASGLIPSIVQLIIESAPLLLDAAVEIVMALANGILDNIDTLSETITTLVEQLTQFIVDNAEQVTEGAIEIALTLFNALVDNIPTIIEAVPQIIAAIVEAIVNKLPDIIESGVGLIEALIEGILSCVDSTVQAISDLMGSVKDAFDEYVQNAKEWGQDLISNFIDGVKEKWESLKSTISEVASTVKEFLGFSEPEKGPLSDFHTYAPDMMELFAKGIKDNENVVTAQINKSFDFGGQVVQSPRSIIGGIAGAAQDIVVNITETIDGATLARNQYRYNVDEQKRHGAVLVTA